MREEKVRWKVGEESFYKFLNNEIFRLLVFMVYLYYIDYVYVMIVIIIYFCIIVYICIIFLS